MGLTRRLMWILCSNWKSNFLYKRSPNMVKNDLKDYFLIKGNNFERKVTIRVIFSKERSVFEKKPPSRKSSFDKKKRPKEVRFDEEEPKAALKFNFEEKKGYKGKMRNLQNELFEKDKKISELKFELNDLQLQIDEQIGTILDLKKENEELSRQNTYSKIGIKSLSGTNPLFAMESNFGQIEKLLAKETPELKDMIIGVINQEKERLRDEYDTLLRNFEKERTAFFENIPEKKSNFSESGDMRNYIAKIEKKGKDLEGELEVKNREIEKLKMKLLDLDYSSAVKGSNVEAMRMHLGNENTQKCKKEVINGDLQRKLDDYKTQVSALQDQNMVYQQKIGKLENEVSININKALEAKQERVESDDEFSNLMKQFTRSDLRLKQATKRLEFIKETIFDILEYLEAADSSSEDPNSLQNRKRDFMENIAVFIQTEEERENEEENDTFNAIHHLENKIMGDQRNIEVMGREMEELRGRLKEAELGQISKNMKDQKKLKELEEMASSYEIERVKLLNEIERLNSVVGRNEAKAKFENFGTKNRIVEDQASRILELERKIRELEDVNDDLVQKLSENSSRISKEISRIRDLELQVETLEEENRRLKAEKYQKGENLNLKILNEKNDLIEKLQSEVRELNEKSIRMTMEITNRNNLISELTSQLQEEKEKVERYEICEENSRKEISRLKGFLEEIDGSKKKIIEEYESQMEEANVSNIALIEQINEMNESYKHLENLTKQYEKKLAESEEKSRKLQNEKNEAEERMKCMDEEVKDLRINIDKHVGQKTQDLNQSNNQVKELKEKIKELEKKELEIEKEYKQEIDKMMEFHNKTINMLKDENGQLDKRLMQEIEKRNEESKKWRLKEQSYINEMTNNTGSVAQGRHSERSVSSRGRKRKRRLKSDKSDTMSNLSHMEAQLKQKHHEVVDLNAQLDQASRECSKMSKNLRKANQTIELIKEENEFLKSRHQALQENLKRSKIMNTISSKSDLEIIKELNDLREKVMDLKSERNRILEQLKDNDLIELGERREKEVTSECFLGYIKRLIDDKKSMGELIAEKEDHINGIVKGSMVLEEKCRNLENEIKRFSKENEKLRKEIRDMNEEAKERDVEVLKTQELLSRQKIEFEAGLNEQKIMYRQAESERKRVFFSIKNLKNSMKEMEKDCKEALGYQEMVAEFERKRFLRIVNDLQNSFKGDFAKNSEIEILKGILLRVVKGVNTVSNKEAKIKELEDKNKKNISVKKGLKKEIKSLKDKLTEAVVQLDDFQSLNKMTKTTKKNLKKKVDRLKEQILNTHLKPKTLELDEDRLTLKEEVKVLESEVLAKVAKMRKKDKEILALKEKLSDLEYDLEGQKSKFLSLKKENKSLNKVLNKTEKNFKREVKNLVNKIEGSNELIDLKGDKKKLSLDLKATQDEIKILTLELKQKKDSIDSLRALKDTYEAKSKKSSQRVKQLKEKLSKVEGDLKEEKRKSENMELFRSKYNDLKQELTSLKAKLERFESKNLELKNDVERKDSIIEQIRKRLEKDEKDDRQGEEAREAMKEHKKTIRKIKKDLGRKDKVIQGLQEKVLALSKTIEAQKLEFEEEISKTKVKIIC